jgi:hypothetical protein
MQPSDANVTHMPSAAEADATLSAAATELAAAGLDRDRDDNGLEEVKRIMVEVKSAKPK